MNIPHWIPWKSEEFSCSLPVPRCAPYGVTTSVNTVHCTLHTRFVYEMIRITKRCVTFNKYARNVNFHNEMKTTVTLSETHAALSFSVA